MALLLVAGCTNPAPKAWLTPSEIRAALWEKGNGGENGAAPAAEGDAARPFGGQMSGRLAASDRVPERAPVVPAPEVAPWNDPLPAPPARAVEQRISVQVTRTPARAFFASLVSQDPSLNMIVHPDVEDEISVELKNVSVDEAVEIVCEMYKLDCQPFVSRSREGVRGYKIFPWQLTTRTYPVDFLSVVRDGYSQTLVNSGNRQQVTTTSTNKDQSKSTTATPSSTGSGMRTEYKSDFWTDLENTITSILQLGLIVSEVTEDTNEQGQTKKQVIRKNKNIIRTNRSVEIDAQTEKKRDGDTATTNKHLNILKKDPVDTLPKEESDVELLPSEKGVVINRQAGLITVRAYPREHQEIATFLEQLRTRSQRQVILEARILEVTLSNDAQFGIDWLAVHRGIGSRATSPLLSEPNGGNTFANQTTTMTNATNNQTTTTGGVNSTSITNAGGTSSTTSTVVQAAQAFVLSHAAGVDQPLNLAFRTNDFIGFVHLLQQQGKVQVLSSPRVATVNNQKAVIKVGSDEFFITGIQPGTTYVGSAAQVIQPSTVSMESMFTGISLDVTPQIGEGEMITLHIHPLVTEVQDKIKSFFLDGSSQSLPLAYSQTRETDSIIRVRNGEVAVIGGLMKNSVNEEEDHLPLLNEIPVLGRLLGQEGKKRAKSELVILLRPVVVDSGRDWEGHIAQSAERIRGMAQSPP
ncbi:MAG: secretin N-terminal domain-containing protein [Magnetococcales bacterium]|nr:secretin N-terminal domain-containing protein [Magnetococcales bacterium]